MNHLRYADEILIIRDKKEELRDMKAELGTDARKILNVLKWKEDVDWTKEIHRT